jgi:hypothetical protein
VTESITLDGREAMRRVIAEARRGRLRRTFGVMAALSALVSGWEAYAQHLRGAYNDWLMWTPVALTPPMVVAGFGSVVSERIARVVLPWLSLLVFVDGMTGFIFHLRGVGRLPGGFRFAVYNITMGPPIFAPLFFLSVAVLGFFASASRPEQLGDLRSS